MGFLKKKKLEEANNELAEVKAEINKEQEVPPIAQAEAQEIEVYEPEDVAEVKEEPTEEPVQDVEPTQAPVVKESVAELREKIRIAEEEAAMVEEEEVAITEEPVEPELTEEIVKETLLSHEQRLRNLEASFYKLRSI